MYEYHDWHHSLQLISSAAAVALLEATPAQGEVWRIIAASAYHDDPAAHDVYWSLKQGATTLPMETGANLATNYKHQLYNQVKVGDAIELRYGEAIVINSSVAMAAGKKFYISLYLMVKLGVTG
jgi:hypothetical protein